MILAFRVQHRKLLSIFFTKQYFSLNSNTGVTNNNATLDYIITNSFTDPEYLTGILKTDHF